MAKTLEELKAELAALVEAAKAAQKAAPPPAEAQPEEAGPPCLHPGIREFAMKGMGFPDCAGKPGPDPCWHPDIKGLVSEYLEALPPCEAT